MAVELFSYWRSSCSWRVRIALALKKIDYSYRAVNLLEGGQTSEEYKRLNPLKEVPSLVIDGHTLCESVAILEYLEETRPSPSLLPKDPFLRAKTRQIVETIAGDIQPVQNLRVLKKVGDEKKAEWGKYWIEHGFEGLESILKETSGKYCVGDQITFADCLLVPQVYNARRFGVEMSKFPIISRLDTELNLLPEFQAAHADNQPDCPK